MGILYGILYDFKRSLSSWKGVCAIWYYIQLRLVASYGLFFAHWQILLHFIYEFNKMSKKKNVAVEQKNKYDRLNLKRKEAKFHMSIKNE